MTRLLHPGKMSQEVELSALMRSSNTSYSNQKTYLSTKSFNKMQVYQKWKSGRSINIKVVEMFEKFYRTDKSKILKILIKTHRSMMLLP